MVTALCSVILVSAAPSSACMLDAESVWHATWRFAATQQATGAALVTHGLNADPSTMNPTIVLLNNAGFDVVRVDLRGHGSNYVEREQRVTRLELLRRVTAGRWQQDLACGYETARRRAQEVGGPLIFAGMSLGGVLGLDLLEQGGGSFDRMILLAPAIRVHPSARLVQLLSPLPRLDILSLSSPEYRANPATPVAAYLAAFELIDGIAAVRQRRINVPTLVLIDEEDEIVDAAAVRRFRVANGLSRWRGYKVRKSAGALPGAFHHHITDASAVGRQTWKRIERLIQEHVQAAARAE